PHSPGSNSASSSKAPTPARAPVRHRPRSATASTATPFNCSTAPCGSSPDTPPTDRRYTKMAWDFSTEPEFQKKLDWMTTFVRDEIRPLETLDLTWPQLLTAIAPLQQEVKN